MSEYITIELQFFLISIVTGIIILIVYDLLRILRRVVRHTWFFVALEDILFWITSGIVIFIMMYRENNGIIRGFSILGMMLGMVIYNQSISKYFVRGVSWLFCQINRGILKVMIVLTKPFGIAVKQVKKGMDVICKNSKKFTERIKHILKRDKKKSRIKHKKK